MAEILKQDLRNKSEQARVVENLNYYDGYIFLCTDDGRTVDYWGNMYGRERVVQRTVKILNRAREDNELRVSDPVISAKDKMLNAMNAQRFMHIEGQELMEVIAIGTDVLTSIIPDPDTYKRMLTCAREGRTLEGKKFSPRVYELLNKLIDCSAYEGEGEDRRPILEIHKLRRLFNGLNEMDEELMADVIEVAKFLYTGGFKVKWKNGYVAGKLVDVEGELKVAVAAVEIEIEGWFKDGLDGDYIDKFIRQNQVAVLKKISPLIDLASEAANRPEVECKMRNFIDGVGDDEWVPIIHNDMVKIMVVGKVLPWGGLSMIVRELKKCGGIWGDVRWVYIPSVILGLVPKDDDDDRWGDDPYPRSD